MVNNATTYTIRSFDGWGAVYRSDHRVFEGDTGHCIDFVFEETGITHEKDCAFIANNERAAESLTEAKGARHPG